MSKKLLDPIPPGEILLEEFMKPSGISQNRLGRELDVPITRINEIIHGKRTITADTAVRLARFFGTTPEMWLHLQVRFDLELARRAFAERLAATITPLGSSGESSGSTRGATRPRTKGARRAK